MARVNVDFISIAIPPNRLAPDSYRMHTFSSARIKNASQALEDDDDDDDGLLARIILRRGVSDDWLEL